MRSWSFFGGPGSLSYWLFDHVRTRVNNSLVTYLLENAIKQDSRRVLEAGSGTAYASSLFARTCRVSLSVAVDIDIEALRHARDRDPKLPVIVGDLHALPFRSESFDLVWNSSTIEHLARPDSALAEMQRVSRRHGYVFVGVPYRDGPLGFQHWIADSSVGVWIGRVFGREEVGRLAEKLGLRVVSIRFYFLRFFIGVLAQRV